MHHPSCCAPPPQYRVDRATCAHRIFNEPNQTVYVDGWVYQPETGGWVAGQAAGWAFGGER